MSIPQQGPFDFLIFIWEIYIIKKDTLTSTVMQTSVKSVLGENYKFLSSKSFVRAPVTSRKL